MSWVFHLKSGVTFHDGTSFDAQTVADWIPLFEGPDSEYPVAAIEHVEVIDAHTAKFMMVHPDPNLFYNLARLFLSVPEPKSVKAMGDNFGVTEAVGTGPCKLESFEIGRETVLARNDAYTWGSPLAKNTGPATFERLTFREIAEDATAFLKLKPGGVDMLMSVPNEFLARVKKQDDLKFLTLRGREINYLAINVAKAPFTNICVRQAAALAINQTEILDRALFHLARTSLAGRSWHRHRGAAVSDRADRAGAAAYTCAGGLRADILHNRGDRAGGFGRTQT